MTFEIVAAVTATATATVTVTVTEVGVLVLVVGKVDLKKDQFVKRLSEPPQQM